MCDFSLILQIIAPSNTEDDCFIQAIDGDEYSIRFYPREHGIHGIHVKFNGVHINGSPFRVKVGKDVADPAIVTAEGPGLKDIVAGHKTFVLVNTCDAGTGSLSVTIDGPSKVAMDCSEVDNGYKVRYTPMLPGEHYMSIKYNNIHIVGSPFKVSCTGKINVFVWWLCFEIIHYKYIFDNHNNNNDNDAVVAILF